MKRVCAWCTKEMGGIDSRSNSEKVITHGICDDCTENVFFQMGVEFDVYLDSLKVPIVTVDGEGTIVSGNDRARTLLGKKLPEIKGFKGGDVFECAYARLPGGCGNTRHCSGCTIRRTVMETHETGKGLCQIPAMLNRKDEGDPEKINLVISTEKVAGLVLLRIDEMGAKNGP